MVESPPNPHKLEPRGLELFGELTGAKTPSRAELIIIVEACRLADRLERLNDLIIGDEDAWFRIKLPRTDEGVVELLINDPMKEARMHAAALPALLAKLEPAVSDPDEQSPSEGVPSNVADIKSKLPPKLGGAAARKKRPAV